MPAIAPMSVAELATRTGFEVADIRSYQEMGLLPGPRRRRGRSADVAYHQEHLDRLTLIRNALDCGFSLEAIASIVGANGGLVTCSDVYRIAERQIANTQRKIGTLQQQVQCLANLMEACTKVGPGADCPILIKLRRPGSAANCCR